MTLWVKVLPGFEPRLFYLLYFLILAARFEAQTESEAIIYHLMRTLVADLLEIFNYLGDLKVTTGVLDHRNGAHRRISTVVQPHFNRRATGHLNVDHAIGDCPIGRSVVNKSEN